jgi:hypothetical protein
MVPAAAGLAGSPSRVTDRKTATVAGIHGIMFSISSGRPGPVHGGMADTSFVAALGGDYAARLRLVRLPACALTTPLLLRCQRQTPLRPVAIGALTAQVTLQRPGGLPVPAPKSLAGTL